LKNEQALSADNAFFVSMKTLICLAVSFFFLPKVQAQSFPADFIGHWKGEIDWFQQGNAMPKKIQVQLVVRPVDTAGHFTWQIIYGDKETDNRPYVLKPVDTAKGHWIIDERNGIVLDQFWLGNKLTGVFTVNPSTVFNSYWLEGNKLLVEFIMTTAKPSGRSGNGTEESPHVDSYQVKSFQRGILSKVKP
jgi:hypothetical protein